MKFTNWEIINNILNESDYFDEKELIEFGDEIIPIYYIVILNKYEEYVNISRKTEKLTTYIRSQIQQNIMV